ncbi:31 glucosidase [Coleophoma crateriformis]|uniref:31 glucosidase n=1 Tax=Coleophoma crateriformis TaxID=565419 RepID=A0A3D8Q5Z4_9HELO|nr:31 glucosidase [Coleophoma crateriformis]
MLDSENNILNFHYNGEHLQIEAWGPDAFRVRSTKASAFPPENWALSQKVPELKPAISIPSHQSTLRAPFTFEVEPPKQIQPASITNGAISAFVTALGKLTIRNNITGKQILEEYTRNRVDVLDPKTSALEIAAREFKSHGTGATDYHLTYRLESQCQYEKIYGMGQYQQPYLDLKGLDIELAQRNSQASVPFLVSSLGYGMLWNSPSVGRAVFGRNIMSFEANATTVLDFWIVVGETPKEIMHRYADVTGHAPMMPEYGLGFWQCKLRYQTQEELLTVAREYKRRELPLDVIVIDFFHWPFQGEWKFDSQFWPDPDAMIKELDGLGIKILISIWPTVDKRSENFSEMYEKGYLIRTDRGIHIAMDFMGNTVHTDFTHPDARKYVWQIAKKNYFDKGIRCFWLDEAEPEYNIYDYDNYRYWKGTTTSIGNIYPVNYAQAFYEGQLEAGQELGGKDGILNLIRCAWAGSQRYATLVWSGDIASSWSSFRNQLAAGLNMGMAGIPWWTTDIGGFHGGVTKDDAFRELLVRWFQWGTFCPVMRLHGNREPIQPKVGSGGGSDCQSGADNEVWSFGDNNYPILVKYMKFRERLRSYTRNLMKEASEKGTPVMRTMFLEFPQDETCWSRAFEDQYMFGEKYLCAPIMEPGVRERKVYLPKGAKWALLKIGEVKDEQVKEFDGGQTVVIEAPIEDMPVLVKL